MSNGKESSSKPTVEDKRQCFQFLFLAIIIAFTLLNSAILIYQLLSNLQNTNNDEDSTTTLSASQSTLQNITADVSSLKSFTTSIFKNITYLLNLTSSVNEREASNIQDAIKNLLQVQHDFNSSNTMILYQLISTNFNTARDISELVNNTSTDIIGTIANILQKVEELIKLQNQYTPLPKSCKEIKDKNPNSVTGVYKLGTNKGEGMYTYCYMEELCGSEEGGWTRIAYLNMSDYTENCPTGFNLYESNGVRACGRTNATHGSCESVKFPSNGVNYTEVCGRVLGYQFGLPDALYHSNFPNNHSDVNSIYVDGISITHGSPRQHIWTLMASIQEHAPFGNGQYLCPCANGSSQVVTNQSFIGENYYCESGRDFNATMQYLYRLQTHDVLWDGQNCGPIEEECCTNPNLPWFNKVFSYSTTDYIELRVCCDEGFNNEDVPVYFYEIYVK